MAVCRLCKAHAREAELLKYGTRHYAHAKCWLAAGRSIDDLQDWQIRGIPALLLKRYGLLDHPRVVAITSQIVAELEAAQVA